MSNSDVIAIEDSLDEEKENTGHNVQYTCDEKQVVFFLWL